MLRSYFKIALRNLRRKGVISAINVFGLSIGLATCLLIAAYVRDETQYDRYATRAKTFTGSIWAFPGATTVHYPMVDVAVGPGMAAAYPEIEACVRLGRLGDIFVQNGTREFKEQNISLVDSNFFEVFTQPLLEGDAHTALVQPNSLVITRALATKYFGDQPAMGRTLVVTGYGACKITGIIDRLPDASHFHFDAFMSSSTIKIKYYTWSNVGYYTYLVLKPGTDAARLQARFPELVAKYAVPEIARDMGVPLSEAKKAVNTFVFTLTPLQDIHLHSDTKYELEANGSSRYVFIFSALALFILLLACANFTNLSTAGAASRGKEIGIRKVMGSLRKQLIGQFLTESILLTAFAMLVAFGLVLVLLPYFNEVSGKHIGFLSFLSLPALIAAGLLTVVVGAVAGIYPAFFLSTFNTIKVLKASNALAGGRKSLLRSGLVVFQFFVSIALIVATVVVYRQLHFMQDKRLGYDKDQVLYIQDTKLLGGNQDAFRQQLLEDKRVVSASISRNAPGSGSMGGTEIYGKKDPLGRPADAGGLAVAGLEKRLADRRVAPEKAATTNRSMPISLALTMTMSLRLGCRSCEVVISPADSQPIPPGS